MVIFVGPVEGTYVIIRGIYDGHDTHAQNSENSQIADATNTTDKCILSRFVSNERILVIITYF